MPKRLQHHTHPTRYIAERHNTPFINPMINDPPPCSTSNHKWREEEDMVFGPRHERSKTPPKINLDSKTTQTNVPPLVRLEETTRRRQGLSGRRPRCVHHVVHCALKPKPWAMATTTGSASRPSPQVLHRPHTG
jgi:hypothetical protein